MKKGIQIASARSDKKIGSFLFMILLFILSMNLSGQKIHTLLIEDYISGNFVNFTLSTSTYDVSGYLTNILTQQWDVPSSSFKDKNRIVYNNNSDGTPSVQTSQNWNGTTWDNVLRTTYTYYSDGTQKVVTTQSWNGSAFNDVARTTYTYNVSKQILTSISESWNGISWMNATQQANTYTGGYLTYNLFQTWDFIGSVWINGTQTNYTNDSGGNPTLEVKQTWSGSAWVNSQRTTDTYNGSGKLLTEIIENYTAGNFVNYSKETNTYDGSGYLTQSKSQLYDAGSSSFVDDSRSSYLNNPNGTISQVTSEDWNGSAWVFTQRITFTYSGATSVSETIKDADFTIYPNPAYNIITIKSSASTAGSTYSITDQAGRMMLKGKLMDETTSVDISTLKFGIYFIKIGENSQHTFKVIKQDLK
jgi:hypothetical protein